MARPASRISNVVMPGPLAPFAERYRLELLARGYAARSAVNESCQVACLSRWLEDRGQEARDVGGELIEEFLAWRRQAGHVRSQSRPGLLCLLEVLRSAGVAAEPAARPVSATDALLASFERYLLAERGLAAGTVAGYLDQARRFLAGLTAGLAEVTSPEVSAAVLRVSASVSVATAQNFVFGLRAFLRFCFLEGLIDTGLSEAALPVTGRRRFALPRGIADADVQAILASCDRRTALGRRDYAIVILLVRLGLRRGEVAALTLDDIDWQAGELVVRGKGGRADRLPLPDDVGQAIAGWLRRGRPASAHREVFLRDRAPLTPIAAGTVASTVRRACRRAGVAEVGSHRLRHTAACTMMSAGVPLVEVAQVLRHHSLQSTAIYARVDLDRLRLLAAPWPGSAQR
jgi:integrase/recombinase XerD